MASPNKVKRLDLGRVVLPDSHPRASEKTCQIFGFAIEHPDGVVVVDTGVGQGHPVIDKFYSPSVVPVIDALHAASIDERDVTAVVNSHLHFDHCGQNDKLGDAPVWVTAAEVEASKIESYTVPEWATIEPHRLRLSADGESVAAGIRLLHTPGHTPGHQSVVVDTGDGVELVVAQACYSCAEFQSGVPAPSDMHDANWVTAGAESLTRLRELNPVRAHFSHDSNMFRPT